MTDTPEEFTLELSDEDYIEMAQNLPTNPPLGQDGEAAVEEFFPDLTPDELKKLYTEYKKIGGMMAMLSKDAVHASAPY